MARESYIFHDSFVDVYMTRWRRNKSNRATDSKRSNSHYVTYDEQRWRREVFVVPYPHPRLLIIVEYPYREPLATGPSNVVLIARSVRK
jgi:hypothetical protein